MHIKIIAAESLGVRGLSCLVRTETRTIIIDPGLALGYRRLGLLPHPAQVAVGETVRSSIIEAIREATDVVLSHFHGDHVPLPDANPYQLNARDVVALCQTARFWSKGPEDLSEVMCRRRETLCKMLDRDLPNAEDQNQGPIIFSQSVPHGERNTNLGSVMMTRIEDSDGVFVHGSDIQLLDGEAVSLILAWRPDIFSIPTVGPARRHKWPSPRPLENG